MQMLYQDSMALVRHFGKPTFFITMTANSHYPEIERCLYPGQQLSDRLDLIARVFWLKCCALLADLKRGVLGPYLAHCYTIEYQKRGLPHLHLLLFLQKEGRIENAAQLDQVICAELPNPSWDPNGTLADLVKKLMIHGPCGEHNPNSVCMARKTPQSPLLCTKGYPKPFAACTTIREDCYPEYRRRNNGRTWTVPKPGCPSETVTLDNR